ncbi:DUF6119 family protein [Actinoplanes sp. NPDC051633]|uniref:DUF6119 family protein n=1 Tax=Actinoplanes sp. NPDC051633 TaxID=3155670 RepID=UPI003413CC8F
MISMRQTAAINTYRTSVYLLTGVTPDAAGLRGALNHRYLREQEFDTTPTTVAGAPALLARGQVPRERADWCPVLTGLTGDDIAVGYSSAGGALLVAVDDRVYVLTYGTVGRHMVNPDLIDPGFGIAFAIRAVDSDRIKQITRSVLAASGRVDRNLVPGGQHIRQYTIEQWGEIVGHVGGELRDNPQLTVTRLARRPVSIAAANSLRIPLSTEPARLLADLREIGRVCARDTPIPELEFIAQVRPLATGTRTEKLDLILDDLLGQQQPTGLGLAMPAHLVEYEPLTETHEIKMTGYRRAYRSDLELDDILSRVRGRRSGRRLDRLKTGTIGLCADPAGEALLHPATAAHKWITAEVHLESARMIYHEGRWYEIGEHHLDFLRTEIEKILHHPAGVTLPPWTSSLPDEDAYNKEAAKHGFVLLDKRLLKTRQHHRGQGIEACDLLGPNGELIHIKRADRSSPLSHLFFQGEVAADSLLHEQDARERLVELVHAADPSHSIKESFRPTKIVYGIALKSGKPLTAETLYTFSQVALYRAARRLRGDGIDVEVVGIRLADNLGSNKQIR